MMNSSVSSLYGPIQMMDIELRTRDVAPNNTRKIGLTLRNAHMELQIVELNDVSLDDAATLLTASQVETISDEQDRIAYVLVNGAIYVAE